MEAQSDQGETRRDQLTLCTQKWELSQDMSIIVLKWQQFWGKKED